MTMQPPQIWKVQSSQRSDPPPNLCRIWSLRREGHRPFPTTETKSSHFQAVGIVDTMEHCQHRGR